MIDSAFIRDAYSNMRDEKLIDIAEKDGAELTPESLLILNEEFKKRNLDYTYIETIEQKKSLLQEEKILPVKDEVANGSLEAAWNYVFEEKENGSTDSDILKGLRERGVDEVKSTEMVNGMKDKLS